MSGALLPKVLFDLFDDDGNPISGGTAKFYLTETLTPTPVYSDADLNTPLGTTVDTDSAGRFPNMYLDSEIVYRLKLYDQNAVLIRDIDPLITEPNPGAVPYSADQLSDQTTVDPTPRADSARWANYEAIAGEDYSISDDAADNLANINTVLLAMRDRNGGKLLLPKTFNGVAQTPVKVSGMIEVLGQNASLVGFGARSAANTDSTSEEATQIVYTGSSAIEAVVKHYSPADVSLAERNGGLIGGLGIHGGGFAKRGLLVDTRTGATWEDMFVTGVTDTAYRFTCGHGGDYLSINGVQYSKGRNLHARLIDTMAEASAKGFEFDGSVGGTGGRNTSFDIFENLVTLTMNGDGYDFINADNCVLQKPVAFVAGTGWGFTFRGQISGGEGGGGGQVINGPSWPATHGCRILGVSSGYSGPCLGVIINDIDDGNGSQVPTYDADCAPPLNQWSFLFNQRSVGLVAENFVTAGSPSGFLAARAAAAGVTGLPNYSYVDTLGWSRFGSADGVLAFEEATATAVRMRTISGFTDFQFFQKLVGLAQFIWSPGGSIALSTNGQFAVEMTSNTAGNLVYRGSDGTTRRLAIGPFT